MGVTAFGDGHGYGDTVRVVQVGNFSTEFCGGTHTHTSAQVGPLLVTSESSIGSNLRRVEALTGLAAYQQLVDVRAGLDQLGRLLKVPDRRSRRASRDFWSGSIRWKVSSTPCAPKDEESWPSSSPDGPRRSVTRHCSWARPQTST